MEIYIGQQLKDLGAALLLGIALGTVYDLLRPVRLQRRDSKSLTNIVDGLYVLFVLLTIFLFALRIGQGELRLFMLFGCIGGMVFYFLLFSPLLRPLWDFWTDAAVRFLSLLWKPVALFVSGVKKVEKFTKKYFHFLCKYATIKSYKWEFGHIHASTFGKGGSKRHEKGKAGKKNT